MPRERDEAEALGQEEDSSTEQSLGPISPEPTPTSLAEMRARVRALELEQMQLLTRRTAQLETENRLLREGPSPLESEPSSIEPRDQAAPGYLARALVRVEAHIADMEGFAGIGDQGAAAKAKVLAATQACSAMTRLCDDDRFHEALEQVHIEVGEHSSKVHNVINGQLTGAVPGNGEGKTQNWFRTVEVQLLELSGLARSLAQQHTDAAIAAFLSDPQPSLTRAQNPMSFLGDVRSLRDAMCQSADLISANVGKEQSRRRWKRLLAFGLGGTLIVTVNAAGTAVLGPAGVAASGAIGSAAVGAAVTMVA